MDSCTNGSNSLNSPACRDKALSEMLDRLFAAKHERRRLLASLPFEDKVRIVVELQRMAEGLRGANDGGPSRVWTLHD